MKGIFPIDKFRTLQTPFYYYDTKVLRDTLSAINQEVAKYPSYSVHYAVKANANPKVLTIIRESGMGADWRGVAEKSVPLSVPDSLPIKSFLPESGKRIGRSTSDWNMASSVSM